MGTQNAMSQALRCFVRLSNGSSVFQPSGYKNYGSDDSMYLYITPAPGRTAVEAWYNAVKKDFWALASNKSRTSAANSGYKMVGVLGYGLEL
eukprot:m.521850 g.521850  ORF g.521850 m.521850 type:complete len:92 (+) comp21965_c0_seq1:2451-2726(+)